MVDSAQIVSEYRLFQKDRKAICRKKVDDDNITGYNYNLNFSSTIPVTVFDSHNSLESESSLMYSIKQLYLYMLNQVQQNSLSYDLNGLDQIRSVVADAENFERQTTFQRRQELEKIAKHIEADIMRLQFPQNCTLARKMVCDFNNGKCGLNCELHRLAYCFLFAYYLNRTAILNNDGTDWIYSKKGWNYAFLPITNCSYSQIAKDGDKIVTWKNMNRSNQEKVTFLNYYTDHDQHFLPPNIPKAYHALTFLHSHPFAFFIAQFKKFFMRLSDRMTMRVENASQHIPFGNGPIVGIHVRRTDKLRNEAKYHALKEYMTWTEEWFRIQDYRYGKKVSRKIFLATDEAAVIEEAYKNYSNYQIFGSKITAQNAYSSKRYTDVSLIGIVTDLMLLSRCDYLVCTFSSGVGRLAYELMQARVLDAGDNFHSLDNDHIEHQQIAIQAHKAQSKNEIDLEMGDIINYQRNLWNGFSYGKNERTMKYGYYPSYKVRNYWITY